MLQIVDANGVGCGEPRLDSVPRRMLEVEGYEQLGVERAEDELDHALVARADQLHANRAEPVAERANARSELREEAWAVPGELRRKPKAGRSLLRPTSELLVTRQPVAGRVQLDGREALGVEAEEGLGVGAGRIETRPPGRVGPAGSADIHPG